MAFLTTSDISSQLPVGFDILFVDRFLIKIEQELKNMYLVFSPQVEETRKINTNELPDSIFDLIPITNLTNIKIKNYSNTSEKVLTSTDYILSCMNNFSNYTNRIELINCNISSPHFLEITAKFGIYINFNDVNSEAAKLLKAIIIDATIKQLSYSNTDYQTIASAGSGESRVSYNDSMNRQYYSNITLDPEFKNSLSYFL
jgi:hypothetical protein